MLRINGEDVAVRALLGMLQDAASLGELEPGNPAVEVSKRSSATLHRSLLTIVQDDWRHAEVQVHAGAIDFGKFGESQQLNVRNAVRVNEGVPGMGVVIAFHEIWENYACRSDLNRFDRDGYGPAHEQALEVERKIATELIDNVGARVAAVELGAGDGRGWVLDFTESFLVLTARPKSDWAAGRFDATLHQRASVGEQLIIDGLAAGARVTADKVAAVVTALRSNARATARVSGHRTADEGAGLAAQRATAVRSAIANALNDDERYAGQDGSITLYRDARSPGTTLAALRVWAGPEQVVGEEPGATVEVEEPGEEAERD
jgi:hypothetical protein